MAVIAFVRERIADAAFGQPAREVVAALGQHGVEPIGGLSRRIPGAQLDPGNTAQRGIEVFAVGNMALDHRPDVVELHQSDGRVDVVHVVLEAHLCYIDLGARRSSIHAKPAQAPATRQVGRIAAAKHAAVHRGEMFDRLQRVHHVFRMAADRQPGIARAQRMRRVLDHRQAMALGDRADRGD